MYFDELNIYQFGAYYASNTNYDKPGKICRTERELVKVLTKETAKIMKTDEERVRILVYDAKENWGDAGILGADIK